VTDEELLARADAIAERDQRAERAAGCAVLCRDGTVIEGVNVENGAYPLGVCGEKTAYCTAVTMGYKPGDFDLIVINASPCGGCRQWHVEFQVDRVIFANNDGELVEYTADELLPDTFVL